MHDPKMPDLEKPATSLRALLETVHEADSHVEHIAGHTCAVFREYYI